jgi:cleavage stimulation factor subunit 3
MTARACLVELTNLTRGLRRETIPRLPPAPGYDGEDDWNYQVALWKKWIKWEKEDPIVLSKEDPAAFRNRIIYAYKQALMALRFWPDMWFEAAEYCFDNDMEAQGMEFLKQGLQANPESTLLTFKYAERLEHSTPAQDGEAAAVHKGQLVRKPYNDLLDTLYALYAKMQTREKDEIAKIEEEMAGDDDQSPIDDDDDEEDQRPTSQNPKEQKINEVKEKSKVEMLKLSKVISAVWINLMRAMRRIQGHGRVNEPLGGSRQIFADARKKGKITSDVYVASALIEYHCYRDPAALKIFERGMKLFPEDEDFALEYLKHLVNINDITSMLPPSLYFCPTSNTP